MKKSILTIILLHCLMLAKAQSGSLDSSFGKNGIVQTNIGSNYQYGITGYQVLLESGKAIYALINTGTYAIVTKRRLDGSADSSYGENGFSVPVRVAGSHTLAIQKDGKILLAGNAVEETSDFAVARYNTDGSLDSTFGTAGRQTTDFDADYEYASSVAVQSDGKIVVGGHINGENGSSYALARYNADGSPDTSFGRNGRLTHHFGGYRENVCHSIAIQTDQKIVAAGYVGNADDENYGYDFAVARYNADGSFDSTFNGNGKQTTHISNGSTDIANSIAIQQDGRIVLTGTADEEGASDFAVVRYTADGNLDNSFSDDGKQTLNAGGADVAYTVAVQPDGNIVSAGYSTDVTSSSTSFAVARFKTDGGIDDIFNENVKNTIKFNSYSAGISVAAAKDGKIVVVGDTESGFFLFRVNNDGTADKEFADGGILIDNIHQGSTTFTATAVQKDGKILAAGYAFNGSNYAFALARYNANGRLDSTFNGDGKQITGFTSYDSYITSIAIQNDGKIVAAGYTGSDDEKYFALVRCNADGSLDNSFNGNGRVTTDFGQQQNQAYSAAIQPDGKIVVGGSAAAGNNVDFAIARYNTDGSLDKSFSGDGKQTTDFGNNTDIIHSIAIDKSGKIVAAGQAYVVNTAFAIARYNTNGELDGTFGNNGKTTTKTSGDYSIANALAIQADGKIVAAGNSFVQERLRFALARYNGDGSLDPTFSDDGIQYTKFGLVSNDYANTIAIQKNGRIVAGGYTENNYYSVNSALARYNVDGTADDSFGDNGKEVIAASSGANYINSIAIASSKVYAAGYDAAPATYGLVTKYLLGNDTIGVPPTVALTAPSDNAYFIESADIKLNAAASDINGTISKVEFYNGDTLLHTEYLAPYGYKWKQVAAGNYTITARAADNDGQVSISAPVHITVVSKNDFNVSIVSPANNEVYAAPAYVHLKAEVNNPHGKIVRVEFYNGSTKLRNEYQYPYTYVWKNIPEGTYYITAKAIDGQGYVTASPTITIKVTPRQTIVSSKPYSENQKTAQNDALSLRLSPNPANNIVNIYTNVLQENKPATLSIISISGIVLKTINIINSSTRLDVSSLLSGVYTMKIISGEKVMYKQFVKL